LVNTAVHGGDPNWGRVLAVAGGAEVPFSARALEVRIGGHLVARGGAAYPAGELAAARHRRGRRVALSLRVGCRRGTAMALGCNLGAGDMRIHAYYRS
jgi:glutamate N-acetyltransferase / amino-acid N-acetyltransferase